MIEDARANGMVLGQNGKLYDTKAGQALPEGVAPMPLLTEDELKAFPEPTTRDVLPGHVARYLDLSAMADRSPVTVIGETGRLRDKPGFEVSLLTRGSALTDPVCEVFASVLMPVFGHWRVTWDGGETILAPGDTMSVPEGLAHTVEPSMTGDAGLYRITGTQDPAGPTWMG